jgi:hypothetical protein
MFCDVHRFSRALQVLLDVRRCFLAGDWPGFESAVERGNRVMKDLCTGTTAAVGPTSGDAETGIDTEMGLPAECAEEFRLAENELEDKRVAKYVVNPVLNVLFLYLTEPCCFVHRCLRRLLSAGFSEGALQGAVGRLNMEAVSCVALKTAVSAAERLRQTTEGTSALLACAHIMLRLRQSMVSGDSNGVRKVWAGCFPHQFVCVRGSREHGFALLALCRPVQELMRNVEHPASIWRCRRSFQWWSAPPFAGVA